jgi:single-stranded DNA-specific DHH superfamily exonuclease
VAERIPDGWTLIGGQLVQLHCMERNRTPNRATNDVDTVLDIVSNKEILFTFTSTLKDLGFEPETYASGHQIKWCKADAEIDVLFPNAVGERTLKKTGISGGTTIETPGGRRVLDYSEKIIVSVDNFTAIINRPHLLGALFIKSAALGNPHDGKPERHLQDFAVLAALFSIGDLVDIDEKSAALINSAIGKLKIRPEILALMEGSVEGVERLSTALES